MATAKSFTARMLKLFRMFPKDDGLSGTFVPAQVDKKKRTVGPTHFPDRLQRIYDQYMAECMDTRQTLEERFGRYRDLEYCYYNSAIFSTATDLYADETAQSDVQNQYLTVYAKDKEVERYINIFFSRIGLSQQMLRATAFDLCLYADHFWVHTIDPELGITEVTPIDVFAVKDRIEFNALRAIRAQASKKEYDQIIGKSEVLRMLRDTISDDPEDYSAYFKNYLFGYELEGKIVVPPWSMTHFRRLSAHSEFAPFGRPLMINAISPYRKYQSSANLLAIARNANFPIKKFAVKTDPKMTEIDQMEKVNETMNEYHNAANNLAYKETLSPETEIWTADGLINLEIFDTRMDLSAIADVDMLREDMIIATRIPKGYLIPDQGAFGLAGQALLQQSKLFGRSVYTVQTAILEELTNLVRLQFAITGDYDYDEDFEISMNFPVIEQTSEQIRQKTDTLTLADDILQKLSMIMGIEPSDIPYDVARDILSKVSFLTTDDVDNWLGGIYNVKKDKLIQGQGGDMGGPGGAGDMGFGAPTGGFGGAGGLDMSGGGGGLDMGGLDASGGGFGLDGVSAGGDSMEDLSAAGAGGADALDIGGSAGRDNVSGNGIMSSMGSSLDKMGFGNDKKAGGMKDSTIIRRDKMLKEKLEREQIVREKARVRLNEEIVREVYFKAKKDKRLDEMTHSNRHIRASFAMTPIQRSMLEIITKWRTNQAPTKLHD